MREQFETNPHAFMDTLVSYKLEGATAEEGEEFTTNPDELTKAAKDLEDTAEMEDPSYGN